MKSKTNVLFLGLLITTLSGCTFSVGGNSNDSIEGFDSLTNITVDGNESIGESIGNESIGGSIGGSTGGDIARDKTRIRTVNEQIGWSTLESIGNQKMLVIPVQLKNATAWSGTMLSELNSAFFGTTNDVNWQSVSSFYNESSYGALTITGEVASTFVSTYTISNLTSKGDGSADAVIAEWYITASTAKLKEYDQDSDGFVDCAVFVYSNAHDGDAFWAWCYYYSETPSNTKPTINNYMWAGYTFMKEGYSDFYNYNKVDAHTYIHETGHLLGLDDYYCYDQTAAWDAAGELEMQAYNVGDQNIYSKMALGWIEPTYVKTSTSKTVTINTSATSPQAILINDNWNGSTFDEYLLLEYYTPKGLNETDAIHQYGGRSKMYDYNGIRLYHIDARLAKLAISGQSLNFISYADRIASDNYVYYVGASNSYSWSYLNSNYAKLYRYVHLLDQGGNNALNNGRGGTVNATSALWTAGKTFTPSSKFFANGTNFNEGNSIGYSIKVDSLTETQATLTFNKI